MSRLEDKTRTELDPEQRAAYDQLAKVRRTRPDGAFGGPFDAWIRSRELADRVVGLGEFLRYRTTLERRIIELAILVTGRFWRAEFEWVAHAPMALKHGLSEPIVEAIRRGVRPGFERIDEETAYEFCVALHEHHRVPEALYRRGVEQFGEQGVMELIAEIGYYTLVSMTLNAFEVPLPEGSQPPFED